jgi:hypothetical protein
MSGNNTGQRAEFIAGLRAFADLVETDPSIPTPIDIDVWSFISSYHFGLKQDERFELVHDFADAHGVTVTEDRDGDRTAEKHFGPVHLRVIGCADEKPKGQTVTRPSTKTAATVWP